MAIQHHTAAALSRLKRGVYICATGLFLAALIQLFVFGFVLVASIFAAGAMVGEFEKVLMATDHFWLVASVHWEDGRGRAEAIDQYFEGGPPMNVP